MKVTDQNLAAQNFVVPAGTNIGHVHLKVADIPRALGFYCGVLGFELQQKFGDQAAFISAGGYHHHIGLNTWESSWRARGFDWVAVVLVFVIIKS